MTRETDYAIFERVFGGKILRDFNESKYEPGDVLSDEAAKDFWASMPTDCRPATVAHYSESNAESMAVLVKCCERGTILVGGSETSEYQFMVRLAGYDGDDDLCCFAPNLPEAICAFALKLWP